MVPGVHTLMQEGESPPESYRLSRTSIDTTKRTMQDLLCHGRHGYPSAFGLEFLAENHPLWQAFPGSYHALDWRGFRGAWKPWGSWLIITGPESSLTEPDQDRCAVLVNLAYHVDLCEFHPPRSTKLCIWRQDKVHFVQPEPLKSQHGIVRLG